MNNITDFKKPQKKTPPHKKRKVRKSFLAVVIVLILTVFVILSTTVLFPVNSLSVNYKGDKYTSQQILSASGAKTGDNFFMLSKTTTAESICKKLPYFQSVTVQKKFPDKVVFVPKETKAAYCFKVSEGYLLTDSTLKALEITQKADQSLSFVEGVKPQSYNLGETVVCQSADSERYLKKIQKAAKKHGYTLNYVEINSVSDIKLRLNGRFDITLGTPKQLDEKLDFMAKMISGIEKKSKTDKGKIDLSYFPTKKEGYFTRGELAKLGYGEKEKAKS